MLPEPGPEQVRGASGLIAVVIILPCVRSLWSQDPTHPFLLARLWPRYPQGKRHISCGLSLALPPGWVGCWPVGGGRVLCCVLFYLTGQLSAYDFHVAGDEKAHICLL